MPAPYRRAVIGSERLPTVVSFLVVKPIRMLMERRARKPDPDSAEHPCPGCRSQVPKKATLFGATRAGRMLSAGPSRRSAPPTIQGGGEMSEEHVRPWLSGPSPAGVRSLTPLVESEA